MNDEKDNLLRPKIIGLSHMTFQSSEIERTLAFYRNVLGYEEVLRLNGPDGQLSHALVRINDRQWIELRPEHTPKSDRLIQFGFQVEDAEVLRSFLASKNVKVPDLISIGETGNKSFYVKDPDGHTVEFIQYIPKGWPLREAGKSPGAKALSNCLMHIGFDVFSMDRSMSFYRDILGCVEMWRGSSDDKTLAWVQLRLSDDINYIEFMLYDESLSLESLGIFNHFGLEVSSMSATMEEVSKRLSSREYPRTVEYGIGKCHHRLANVFDHDGTRVEFMERKTFDGAVTPSSTLPPPR